MMAVVVVGEPVVSTTLDVEPVLVPVTVEALDVEPVESRVVLDDDVDEATLVVLLKAAALAIEARPARGTR